MILLSAGCSLEGQVGGSPAKLDGGGKARDRAIQINRDGAKAKKDGPVQPGKDQKPPLPGKKNIGGQCGQNSQCKSNICYLGKCTSGCKGSADCPKGQDCGSDNGKRLICYARSYKAGLGQSCSVSGSCPGGLTCAGGGKGYAQAYCTTSCANDTGCPSRFSCQEVTGQGKKCVPRSYCSLCMHSGQCNNGFKCINQPGGGAACLKPCKMGSTECPKYASCSSAGGGSFCVHKSGSCRGSGGLCSPCAATSDCNQGGLCLTYSNSGESFCAASCSGGSCPGGYSCYSKYNKCVPSTKSSCVPSLSSMMEVGDTMEDFAMVGKWDTNKDYSLAGEKLQLLRLSQFKSAKVIMFSVAAGWCGPCKTETKQFKSLLQSLGPKGLVVFQSLTAGVSKTSPPTPPDLLFLDAWIGSLSAVGAIGIDPGQRVGSVHQDAPRIGREGEYSRNGQLQAHRCQHCDPVADLQAVCLRQAKADDGLIGRREHASIGYAEPELVYRSVDDEGLDDPVDPLHS